MPLGPEDVRLSDRIVIVTSDLSRFVTGTTLHVEGGNFAAGGWWRRVHGSLEP